MLRSSVILDIAIAVSWSCGVDRQKKGLFRSLAELVIYLVGLWRIAGRRTSDGRAVELLRPVLESRVSQTVSGYLSGPRGRPPGEPWRAGGARRPGGRRRPEAAELLAETLLHDLTYVIVFLAVFLARFF